MLHVKIVQGTQLPAVDSGGTIDAYVKIYVLPTPNTDTMRYLKKVKTSIVKKSLTPQWNQVFSFDTKSFAASHVLRFELWDWNRVQSRSVSYAIVPVSRIQIGNPFPYVLEMTPIKKKWDKGGLIHVVFHHAEANCAPFETVSKTTAPVPQTEAKTPQTPTQKSEVPNSGPVCTGIRPEEATVFVKMPTVMIEKANKERKKKKSVRAHHGLSPVDMINGLGMNILTQADVAIPGKPSQKPKKRDPRPKRPKIGNGDSSDEDIVFDEELSDDGSLVGQAVPSPTWNATTANAMETTKHEIHIIAFGADSLHNENEGVTLSGELERRLKTRRFHVDNQELRSSVNDINEMVEACDPASVLLLIMSNSAIAKMRVIGAAYNETNFVIPDIEGCQFDPNSPIFLDMDTGEEICSNIDISRLLGENPSFELGYDVDRFLANYAYAKALRHNTGNCILIETPGFDQIPLQSQVASLMCLVEYIVEVVP